MANVEHNALTDPELHEPKGIAAASSGQVYVADGAASGAWTSQDPAYAQGSVTGNATVTSIATIDTPVAVAFGGGFTTDLSNKFTISANGVMTYTGTPTRIMFVTFTIAGSQASASDKLYTFYIAKNGTVIDSSLSAVSTDGTNIRNSTVDSVVSLATNDTIALWVENNSDTTNITIESGKAIATQLGF